MMVVFKERKFINHTPPKTTQQQKDVVLYRLRPAMYNKESIGTKIEKFEIYAEQAYKGCGKTHFYVYLNDVLATTITVYNGEEKEYHKYNRWYDWVYWFIAHGFDLGEFGENAMKEKDHDMKVWRKIDELIKHKNNITSEYDKMYRSLEKFSANDIQLLSEMHIESIEDEYKPFEGAKLKDWTKIYLETISEEQFLHWFENSKIIDKTRFGINVI